MKTILAALAAAACVAGTARTFQEDDRAPVNKTCPVQKGKPIKEEFMSVYEGRPIAFCCGKCKKLWDEDPSEYAANLPPAERPKEPGHAQLRQPAPLFELKDTDGSAVKLADFKDQIVVLQWTDPACPVSKRLAADGVTAAMIAKIKRSASDKLFHFSICSAAGAKPDAVGKFLSENKVDSKGLMDPDGKIAKAYGARTTPHVFVIGVDGVLHYSGAIDNDPDGKRGDKAVNYVVEAVTSILAGKRPKTEKMAPYGTALKLPK